MIGHIEKAARSLAPFGDAGSLLDSESWVNLPWKRNSAEIYSVCAHRTYKAVRESDTAKARSLQKLIMRSVTARFLAAAFEWEASYSKRALAIRQVTQLNNGKKTAGIDGKLALDFKERFELEQKLKTQAKYRKY